MIDLHMHTTASDGRSEPATLVREAWARGIRTMSVTDHDTTAGTAAAAAECERIGMGFVPGIEITAVSDHKDVHVLGYGVGAQSGALATILAAQREQRVARAREIADRLARAGAPIDIESLLEASRQQFAKSLARPQIAQALIAAGHAQTVAEAFERFLGEHCPAYVPHLGASPAEVVKAIASAGGVASLAHPGYSNADALIPLLVEAGLPCVEAIHSSHDDKATERYLQIAKRYDLAVTGGSDYHGEGTRRSEFFGVTALPSEYYQMFERRLERAGEKMRLDAG